MLGLLCYALPFAALLWATLWGLGDWLHRQVEPLTHADAATIAAADLNAALATVTLARRIDPLAPAYRLSAGRLREQAARDPTLPAAAAAELLAEAEVLYLEALRRQPTWPYGVSALYRVMHKRGEETMLLEQVLARGLRLGRYEAGFQRSLIETGLALWPRLSPAQADAIQALLVPALSSQPGWLLATAARLGRWDLVAPLVDDDPRLAPLVRRYGPPAHGSP